jgi:hypothetical protein
VLACLSCGLPSGTRKGFHHQRNAPVSRGREVWPGIHLRLEGYSWLSIISCQRKETDDSLDGAVYDIRDQERSQPTYPEPALAQTPPAFYSPRLRPTLRPTLDINLPTTRCYDHMTLSPTPRPPLLQHHVAPSAQRLPQHEQWLQPASTHV